jgi:hypothetical protein
MIDKWNRRDTLSVVEEIIEVANDICTNYCKYAAVLEPDKDEDEALMNKKCNQCPLNRLGV